MLFFVGMRVKTPVLPKKKNTDKKSRSIFVFSTPPTSLHCNDIVLRGLQLRDVSGERMRQERLRNLFRTPPGQTTHKTPFSDGEYNPARDVMVYGRVEQPRPHGEGTNQRIARRESLLQAVAGSCKTTSFMCDESACVRFSKYEKMKLFLHFIKCI